MAQEERRRHGGRTATGIDLIKWCKYAVSLGAGEILLTSMDKDGTKDGYDNAMNKAVHDAVNVPLIASGGAGRPEHLVTVFRDADADAAIVAGMIHTGDYTIAQIKDVMHASGVPTRITF